MKAHVCYSAVSNSYSFEFEAENKKEAVLLTQAKEGMYGKEFLAKMFGYSESDQVIKKVSFSFTLRHDNDAQLALKPKNELPC